MKITSAEFEATLKDISFPLAIAISGGPDSLALLLLIHDFAIKTKKKIIALTVDHGLRTSSYKEALYVQKLAHNLGIQHVILKWEMKKPTTRIQEKAREARYDLLLTWCKNNQVPTLLLGHHQQDQEETFWLRLSSGSGLDGLTGMKPVIEREGILIYRPLLNFSKERLKATLKAKNQEWIEDPSNESSTYFRGRFRAHLKEEGLTYERLLAVMMKLQEDADFINSSLLSSLQNAVKIFEEGYFTLQRDVFEALHPALAKRMISLLIKWFSRVPYPPRSTQVEGVFKKIREGQSFTAGRAFWVSKPKEILILREAAAMKEKIPLSSLNKPHLWDNRFWVSPHLKNALLQKEALLIPLGNSPFDKDKVISSFPSSVWPTLPAIEVKGKIVSIPHLCYNIENEVNQRKFFYLKPLFHDSLTFTI
ncbi:MAG: tRNA lysidine(34) synthetase TilS [Alphaproteobacteria bacterium]|nr:tRNA lysidine(34) synthetase TilS [Alphaproteobacteria bacterium]